MTITPFREEHDQLRASLRRLITTEFAPEVDAWERAGHFPDEVFHRLGELGFLGLTVDPAYGGQGADYWATVVLGEELPRIGHGSVPMAVAVQTDMATPPIAKFGTEEQKQAYLVPAVAGQRIGAIAITEPEAGSDVARIRTRARREPSGDWILNGTKTFITNGARASWATMVVRTGDHDTGDPWGGISLFLVDTDLPGFEVVRTLDKVGMRASDTAELSLVDVRLPASALLGTEGLGFKQIMWELQGERLIAAVMAVAGAQLSFEHAERYARDRSVFGKPLIAFQVQKHRLVDMVTRTAAVRALVYEAADKWNRGIYATAEIAMCKLAAAQLDHWAADEALQIFGGAGYSQEFPIERAWRDSRLGRIGGGTDEVQREVISKLMGL